MNITEAKARQILQPYQATLRDCIVSAWQTYHSVFSEIKHILSSRSEASIIFDFTKHNVKKAFERDRNVYISEKRKLFLVNFADKVVVRFKKLRNNKASCIPTQQALAFFAQLELPEIPSPERFVVGYELNSIRTEIKAISVIYPQTHNRNYWSYDLEPVVANITPKEDVMPGGEQGGIFPQTERIVIKDIVGEDVAKNE